MPTTTNPTPAEIASLECDIAERVMGWTRYTEGAGRFIPNYYSPPDRAAVMVGETGATGWSPWNNAADALAVLKQLRLLACTSEPKEPVVAKLYVYISFNGEQMWSIQLNHEQTPTIAPGDHFGPAVCLLARKVMEESK